jgi:glucose/mannose-6-phosphate isomerase
VSDHLEAIRAVDEDDLLGDVLGLPGHLTDALWRVESMGLRDLAGSGLVVCGMGGSAVGADLARAAIGDRLALPLVTVRDYYLAPWTPPDRVVLCSSYSGNTEETIACFEAAEAIGAKRLVATTGGKLGEIARAADVPVIGVPAAFQPRASAGYMFVIAAEIAAMVGAAPAIRTEIDSAAALLPEAADSLAQLSAEIADRLGDAIPCIYGSDLTGALAYRWKTQINENAKQHAFSHRLPELDHNEIVGWNEEGGGKHFAAVVLHDSDQHPRERQRAELTAKLIAPGAADVIEVETVGHSRTERMLWGLMLGDLVSLQLAARRGVDPSPVPVLEQLKDELGRP